MHAPPMNAGWAGQVLCRVAARRRAEGDTSTAAALLVRALREDDPVRAPQVLTELALTEVAARPRTSDLRLQEVLLGAVPDTAIGVLAQAADLLECRGDARTAHRAITVACQRRPGADTAALAAIGWLAADDSATDPVLPVPPLPELPDPLAGGTADP